MSENPYSATGPETATLEPTQDQQLDTSTTSLAPKKMGLVSTLAVVDQAVVSLASFAVAVSIGRACGDVELGIYSFAVKIFWLVAGIPNALIWIPYTSRAPRLSGGRRDHYLGSVTTHLFGTAAAISALLLICGTLAWMGIGNRPWVTSMCLALIPFGTMMLLKEHLRRILLAHMDTKNLLLVDIPIAILQVAALGVLIFASQLNAVTALLMLSVACGWGAYWILAHRNMFRFSVSRAKLHWSYNFQFGKWLVVVSLAWLLGDAICYFLVESFHGLKVMGQYSAAVTTVMFFNPIALTAQNLARSILATCLAKEGNAAMRKMTFYGTLVAALGFGIMFGGLALCGSQLVALIFGPSFPGLGPVVATLCLGMYVYVLSLPVEGALSALQDGKAMLIASVVRCALILLSGIPLIANLGPVGVGYALAIGSGAATIIQWILFMRSYRDAR